MDALIIAVMLSLGAMVPSFSTQNPDKTGGTPGTYYETTTSGDESGSNNIVEDDILAG